MKTAILVALGVAVGLPALAEEGGFSEKSKELLQLSIERHGYNCPTIRTINSNGADAYGDVLRVACRVEGAGMTNRVYYRVTLAPNSNVLVEPEE
jgi:hypothetical protein